MASPLIAAITISPRSPTRAGKEALRAAKRRRNHYIVIDCTKPNRCNPPEASKERNTARRMSADHAQPESRTPTDRRTPAYDTKQAHAMLDAFAAVGATKFDVFLMDIHENPRGHEIVTLDALRRTVAMRLEAATRRKLNLIVHPRSATALLVQLDDTKDSSLWSHSFMRLETSPGNYQYWIAVSDGPKDGDTTADKEAAKIFRYRMKRGTGADKFASGSVRLAGSLNIKPKYAPDFPVVKVSQVEPGRTTTVAALDTAGLIGPPPPVTAAGRSPSAAQRTGCLISSRPPSSEPFQQWTWKFTRSAPRFPERRYWSAHPHPRRNLRPTSYRDIASFTSRPTDMQT